MALETLLNFRNVDSTENLNARLAGLIPKGIVKGGFVIPEPASLQVRIKGDDISPFVILAFAIDGMVVRERSEEHVLPVAAGITSVIVLRAKYVEALGGTITQFEVLPLGSYQTDPDPDSLIRLCSVNPPSGATAVLSEHINMSYRDSIEGFSRRIVRDVVGTKEDLPAVSGFPAIAEVNFLHNNFVFGTEIEIGTGSGIVSFPIVEPINFRVNSPSVPGLSRLHPAQISLAIVIQDSITGMVTAISDAPHGFVLGQSVRISANSASQANQIWQIIAPLGSSIFTVDDVTDVFAAVGHSYVTGLKVQVSSSVTLPGNLLAATDYYVVVLSPNTFQFSDTLQHALDATNIIDITDTGTGVHTVIPQADTAFYFNAPLTLAWSGTGGNAVETTVGAIVTAKMAPGVTHTFAIGNDFILTNPTDMTFAGNFTVASTPDAQTITYTQTGYPSADSGNGILQKQGISLPTNAVEKGESATGTAANFEVVFNASLLGPDITATAIGSSLQYVTTAVGEVGNFYTLEKTEPGVLAGDEAIVLSGATFAGGVDPTSSSSSVDLAAGDLYVVLSGASGTMEIWGYDGIIFRNLTSSSTASMLDFHRRNLFLNEGHLTENEKGALGGSVGIPSATNRYLTEQDTSTLTSSIAAALQGADDVPPSGTNRYLTEARQRGERGDVAIPVSQDWVEVPVGDGIDTWFLVAGTDNDGTDSTKAIPFFNVVFSDSLLDHGGPTEYSQIDFTPITIDVIYTSLSSDPVPPPFIPATELNPATSLAANGVFPRLDAPLLGLPTRMWVKLNQVPDNGSASLFFSKVVTERMRGPAADVLAPPQRILSAQVQDVINRTQELRFNAGIRMSGTALEFPANLFSASNLQGFVLNRVVGSKTTALSLGFTIDMEAGTGTGGIVESFTPVTFGVASTWTRYLLALTPQGTVKVHHVEPLLENAGDLAYSLSLSGVAKGSMPFADGSYVFASMAVQCISSVGTAIEDLDVVGLELYPYQGTNEKDYGAAIMCGDGVSSFGHFTGTDAHIRAMAWAPAGSTINLGAGDYAGTLMIDKPSITLEGQAGAVISAVTDTAIRVISERFTARNIKFENCTIAIDLQGGSDNNNLSGLIFGSGVTTKVRAPVIYGFSSGNVAIDPANTITIPTGHDLAEDASGIFSTLTSLPVGVTAGVTYFVINPIYAPTYSFQIAATLGGAPIALTTTGSAGCYFGDGRIYDLEANAKFNQWVVSDGTGTYGVGDFNSPTALQQVHDVASAGDQISILPGVYSKFTVTADRLTFKGIGGGEVRVNGGGLTDPCITVVGSYNQFDNIVLENSAVGIDCTTVGPITATYNSFSPTVVFSSDIDVAIKMPLTTTVKHFNHHPAVSGSIQGRPGLIDPLNSEVTIGDGVLSWGDYVGPDCIQLAIDNESEGTKIIVRAGDYTAFTLSAAKNNFVIEGSGARTIVNATATVNTECINVISNGNKVSGLYLRATNNATLGDLNIRGITVSGFDNLFENIKFESSGNHRIELHRKYEVTSGYWNRFVPHTGAPTGYVSWTVGDGVHSFGDFNGNGGINAALTALPQRPQGNTGVFSGASGNTVTFSDVTANFNNPSDIHRYLTIKGVPGGNTGSHRITSWVDSNTVTLERVDGGPAFTNDTGLYWAFLSGSKIWVLPGQYSVGILIPQSLSDVDLEAWGGGDDTIIVASTPLTIDGNRCRIKGFRFVGSVEAVNITGMDCTFEANRYEAPIRFTFGPNAFGNKIYDAPENYSRTCLTVSTSPSRGDYVGLDEAALQAALDAAALDPSINKVVLGKGTWTLTSTLNMPADVTLEGSGYATQLLGDGLFPAVTLDLAGGQTIKGIRFTTFSNSVYVAAPNTTGAFVNSNWLEAATINPAVVGDLTQNL